LGKKRREGTWIGNSCKELGEGPGRRDLPKERLGITFMQNLGEELKEETQRRASKKELV